jgi:hypothetical protein
MRKVLWLVAGVTVVSGAAFFMGAAAAMTGAPVFYDARYPQAASPVADGEGVRAGESAAGQSGSIDAEADDGTEADADADAGSGEERADGRERPPAPRETPDVVSPDADQSGGRATSPAPTHEPPQAPGRGNPSGEFAVPGGPVPDDAPGGLPDPEERQAWLAFQQIVRECMAAEGQEYGYWEWWNYEGDGSNRYPAMPADLTHDEAVAWELALNGTSRGGNQYRWEDAGCWGFAGRRIGAVG